MKVNEAQTPQGGSLLSPRPALLGCPFCGGKAGYTPPFNVGNRSSDGRQLIEPARAYCLNEKCIRIANMPPEQWNTRAETETQRLCQLIIDAHGKHGTCYWGLGFMFSPDTMKEDCKVCAAKRQMVSIANGMDKQASAYDPDHLNPDKGGNRASDDYWRER